MSTVLPTLTTSASQSLASLAGHIFVRLNATTCLSLRQEHSLIDGVFIPSCLERASTTSSLTIHQSWTVQGWVENPSLHTDLRTPLRTFVKEHILYIYVYYFVNRNVFEMPPEDRKRRCRCNVRVRLAEQNFTPIGAREFGYVVCR